MTITFVRHTAVDVVRGVCYGRSDVGLASTFPEEAERVRQSIKGRHFSHVFTSPLSRCVRLAQYCGYGDAIRDGRLMEMNFGEWEMRRYDEIDDPRLQQWYDDYLHVVPPGGESFEQQGLRVRDFLESLPDDGDVLVFTHAGVIIHALLLSGKATLSNAFSLQPPYGGIVCLRFRQRISGRKEG